MEFEMEMGFERKRVREDKDVGLRSSTVVGDHREVRAVV